MLAVVSSSSYDIDFFVVPGYKCSQNITVAIFETVALTCTYETNKGLQYSR